MADPAGAPETAQPETASPRTAAPGTVAPGTVPPESGPPEIGPPEIGPPVTTPPTSGPGRTAPADRAREEGASASVARWVERIDRALPGAGRAAGFWASVFARFSRHRGSVLAGGLAFFGLLSLVPALLSLGALVTLLYDPAEFAEDVKALLVDRPDVITSLAPTLGSLAALGGTAPTSIGVAGLVGLAVSLYAASRFVYVGQQVLIVAFERDAQPPSMFSRLLAILVTLLAQLAIVVGVIALTVVPRVLELFGIAEAYGRAVNVLRLPLALIVVYGLLTAAMRFGTRARRVVGWVNPGAAVGTALIVVGTAGLSWYLSVSLTYSQIVAVLGGVIALELWLYVVGLAIVVAAEIEGVRHGFRRQDVAGLA